MFGGGEMVGVVVSWPYVGAEQRTTQIDWRIENGLVGSMARELWLRLNTTEKGTPSAAIQQQQKQTKKTIRMHACTEPYELESIY